MYVCRDDTVSFTYEAYASSLSDILHLLSADMLRLERKASAQDETFTLSDLATELRPWTATVSSLHACHRRAAVFPLDTDYWPNWKRAVKMISGTNIRPEWESFVMNLFSLAIYFCLHVTHEATTHELILDMFLKTCVPYLRIIGLWLTEGRLEDFRKEFVFRRRTGNTIENEHFWKDGFEVLPYAESLSDDGLQLPSMLEKVLPKILVAGKSIEILILLGKKKQYSANVGVKLLNSSKSEPNLATAFRTREDLLKQFVSNIKEDLKMPASLEERDEGRWPADESIVDDLGFCDSGDNVDPYLMMAFEEVYRSARILERGQHVSTTFVIE